jgi:cobalt/nickel transport system permease protein
MHMADALLSPLVGGTMLAVSAASIGIAVKKTAVVTLDEKKIPLMGVMGAFVFAGQMINFTIPGTGSSGHIGGGILLAAILGPAPALLTLASVLLIQCLFFADGGLLAYGCNVFNMGTAACVLAYLAVFKPLVRRGLDKRSITVASILACIAALQVGAFCVSLETLASGVTELPFASFVALMQPIHLAIGVMEGLVTAAVLCFVHSLRPEILDAAAPVSATTMPSMRRILAIFGMLTVLIAGILSICASAHPDGLEWAIARVTKGDAELERESAAHSAAERIVERTAVMPDYAFRAADDGGAAGTAVAGIVGSAITVIVAGGSAAAIGAARKRRAVKAAVKAAGRG